MDVIFFGNYYDGFLKSSSIMQLSYQLRKDGIKVSQIHHFLNFSKDEIDYIIKGFSEKGGKVLCLTTSFLSTTHETEDRFKNEKDKKVSYWGMYENVYGEVDVFEHMYHLCVTAKKYNLKVLVGGWEISSYLSGWSKTYGGNNNFEILKKYVNAFVINDGTEIIKKFVKNETVPYSVESKKIIIGQVIKDYSDISSAPIKEDNISENESLFLSIASGCVFSCHFCNFSSLGKKKSEFVRSYDSLKREIVSNYENFGTKFYHVTDNMINDYEEKMKYLVKIKEETGIDFKWAGYVRLDTIKNRKQADLIRDSGLTGALMGIESFTESTGRYIGKMTDGERLKDLLRMCRESWGDTVFISASMIAGLPTETKDMLAETNEFLISEEGSYLIDQFKFHVLHINLDNDYKNDINKSRNHPFRDYEVNGIHWKSPWGTSEEFQELIKNFKRKKTDNNNLKARTKIHAQNIVNYINVGYEPNDLVKTLRTNKAMIKEIRKTYPELALKKIENYKRNVLESFNTPS